MMLDSDNVLLLRPLDSDCDTRAMLDRRKGVLRITVIDIGAADVAAVAAAWRQALAPQLATLGHRSFCLMATADVSNNFPRLPVRKDRVLLWFQYFDREADERAFQNAWRGVTGWREGMDASVLSALAKKPEVIRLVSIATHPLRR